MKQIANTACSHVPPKRRSTFKGLHGDVSQKTGLFITIAVRTSKPAFHTFPNSPTCSEEWSSCHNQQRFWFLFWRCPVRSSAGSVPILTGISWFSSVSDKYRVSTLNFVTTDSFHILSNSSFTVIQSVNVTANKQKNCSRLSLLFEILLGKM
jgi:hypothetical protein